MTLLLQVRPHMRRCLVGLCALLSFVLLVPAEAQAQADLALAKAVSNATPNVGNQITFTIALTNNGPATATGVTVTDLLPAGLTFVSATPSQGTYTSGTGLWNVGTIASGASTTLAIVATVVSPTAQTNSASITASSQADPTPGNNTATVTETPQVADLALAKTVSNPTPNVGNQITFTITLTNSGVNTATNVAVTDLLPAGLTFVSATPSQGSYNSGTGLWSVGTVTTGTPQTLTIVATVVSPNSQTNTASITASDQFDPNAGNNSASATEVPQQANLALTKTVSNATPTVGSNVTFTITLTNAGPSTATGVAATDLLPAGLTLVTATPSQGSYTSATGLWSVGTVTTGTPATLAIVATVTGSSPVTNTATISSSNQFDPNAGNNSATVTLTPQPAGAGADLALAKTVSNATPTVGSNVTFTITLTNNGPVTATAVAVTDFLPAGLTFVSATPSQGTYASATGVWTVWTVTTAVPQTLAIVATVIGGSAMTNVATVTASGQTDPNVGNNTATVAVTPPAPVPTVPTVVLILLMGTLAVLAVRSLRTRRGAARA
jgi:uncharacterized repeat protein (TIGR01451 family)